MKLKIWGEILAVKFIIILPLMFTIYFAYTNTMTNLISSFSQVADAAYFDGHLASLKKLAELDPASKETYKDTFNQVLERKIALSDFVYLKDAVIGEFTGQLFRLLALTCLIATGLSFLLSKRFVKRAEQLIELESKQFEQRRQISFLQNWQDVSRKVVHELKGPMTPIKLIAMPFSSIS